MHLSIDFLFHLFSHLHLPCRPVFFYLFVDNFLEFTLIENAILSRPLTLPLLLLPTLPSAGLIEILLVCVWHER